MLEIDPAVFRDGFGRTGFLIRHRLADDPLFQLPRLVELSRRLDPGQVEYYAGKVPVGVAKDVTPRNGLTVEETIRRIEECCSWLGMHRVEDDPEYGALLHRCLDEVRPHAEPADPGMNNRQGFIFISSPGSTAAFHIDPEHNFLLQVRGRKTVYQFDRSLVSERDLENFYSGAKEHVEFREEFRARAVPFELTPGLGLYFPVTAPHYVQNHDEVSISFSVTWRTRSLDRRDILYTVNHYLRGRGFNPAPVGSSPWRDSVKYNAYRLLRRVRRLWPGGKRAAGRGPGK